MKDAVHKALRRKDIFRSWRAPRGRSPGTAAGRSGMQATKHEVEKGSGCLKIPQPTLESELEDAFNFLADADVVSQVSGWVNHAEGSTELEVWYRTVLPSQEAEAVGNAAGLLLMYRLESAAVIRLHAPQPDVIEKVGPGSPIGPEASFLPVYLKKPTSRSRRCMADSVIRASASLQVGYRTPSAKPSAPPC